MLEDILYLVAYSGYSKDIGPAAVCCKATLTDERIWCPFLIQQTYGPKKKTRFQIILEHTTLLLGDVKQHIILTKDKPLIYRPEERWIQRVTQLEEMGNKAGHPDILQTMLSIPDASGRGLLSIACENNCPTIVSYLLNKGACYNQKDDSGASPCYYAFNSKFGHEAYRSLPLYADYEYPKPKRRLFTYVAGFNQADIVIGQWNIEVIANSQPEGKKKKKMKSKLYKQQFGPKR
jgi:hypothetical protein